MKRRLRILLLTCLTATCVLSSTVLTFADTEGGTDLSNTSFTDEQQAVQFVAYIYIEDDAENNYNNPNRDVGVEFAGAGEYYEWAYNYQFKSSDSFQKNKVIRMTGELPSTGDYAYYPNLFASDTNDKDGTFTFLGKFNDKDYSAEDFGNGILPSELNADYNEFFFVGGNYDWVTTEGTKKLDEIYTLYHSNTGNLSESAAESAVYDEELFTYWQEQMNMDTSIQAWRDENGNVYTREMMNQLGYTVVPGNNDTTTTASEVNDASGESSDNASNATSGEVTEASDTQTAENVIPTQQENTSKRIPPLVFVILGVTGIIGAVIIAYVKREKNESDLYID